MRIWGEQEISPDMERLITMIRNKEIILWAGSGLSLYAGYPSGSAFCDIICDAAKSEEDRAILEKHKTVLMNIAEEFEQLYSRDELIGLVSAHFDKIATSKPHAHFLCTQIPQIDTIITTNYDHLFESVYGDNLSTVVGTQYKTSVKAPVALYKIHGDSSDSSSVVLTSKDYAKFYEGLNSLVWSKLKVILAEHSVLFIGYSLEDKNIEDIFEKVLTQVDTSKSEFFIAVPTLAEHKLRHFNTICKTTHLPIAGETLLRTIEKAIRENIVFDAIDKKISIDQAQAVAHKHGIEPTWKSTPSGSSTEIEIENYIVNPLDSLLKINGLTISSTKATYPQMEQFMDDCDCREMILPPESLKLFETVNGINIPKKNLVDGKKPEVVRIEKPAQFDKVVLTINGKEVYQEAITLCAFWGNKRKRVTVELPSMNISLLYENDSINVTLSFDKQHLAKDALDDLLVLSQWHKGAPLIFSHKTKGHMEPVLQIPPVKDNVVQTSVSAFIDENSKIYQQILKVEEYLNTEFLIPGILSFGDRNAVIKVLSTFEDVDVGDILNLDLSLRCDTQLYEALKVPSNYSIEAVEMDEEQVSLFGNKYTIKEQRTRILSPVIENADEVGKALSQGKEAVGRIVSSTGNIMMRCKL